MAENQNSESSVCIPAGWERRGEGYYCRATEQEFKNLDALLAYVTYVKVFQPELIDSWSEKISLRQSKRGRMTEEAEVLSGVSFPQKSRGQVRKGSATSPIDVEGTSFGRPGDIVYKRRSLVGAKKKQTLDSC